VEIKINEQFAVIIWRAEYHEGDERSRTHPGHGYPAYTTEFQEFKPFEDENEFKKWVEFQEKSGSGKERYQAIKYVPLLISTSISIHY
jgi:hypothetical protein